MKKRLEKGNWRVATQRFGTEMWGVSWTGAFFSYEFLKENGRFWKRCEAEIIPPFLHDKKKIYYYKFYRDFPIKDI